MTTNVLLNVTATLLQRGATRYDVSIPTVGYIGYVYVDESHAAWVPVLAEPTYGSLRTLDTYVASEPWIAAEHLVRRYLGEVSQ